MCLTVLPLLQFVQTPSNFKQERVHVGAFLQGDQDKGCVLRFQFGFRSLTRQPQRLERSGVIKGSQEGGQAVGPRTLT